MNSPLSFKEILDASILNLTSGSSATIIDIMIAMMGTLLCSVIIYFTYVKTYQGVLFQKSYNISLVLASFITTLIIMTISGNLVLSLGMVGALTIIRFRAAIKDPLDIVFMFWSIMVGIANGVASFKISIVGSILLSLLMFGMSRLKAQKAPYILIIKYKNEKTITEDIKSKIKTETKYFKIKTKTIKNNIAELTMEIRLANQSGGLLESLSEEEGVLETILLAYSGDIEESN